MCEDLFTFFSDQTRPEIKITFYSSGFTMIEFLLVIILVGVLGILALPQFLDFRQEGKVAAARQISSTINSALKLQKQQSILRCGKTASAYPPLEALSQNDITAGSPPDCLTSQISNEAERKFFDGALGTFPTNPVNGLSSIAALGSLSSGQSYAEGKCAATGDTDYGWCYDQANGRLIASTDANTLAENALAGDGGDSSTGGDSGGTTTGGSDTGGGSTTGGGDIAGCMTSGYDNYNAEATIDSGCSCSEGRVWNGTTCYQDSVTGICVNNGGGNMEVSGACSINLGEVVVNGGLGGTTQCTAGSYSLQALVPNGWPAQSVNVSHGTASAVVECPSAAD